MAARHKGRNTILTILEVLFALIFLFAVFQAGRILYSYHEGDDFYEQSQNTYLSEEDGSDTAQTERRLGFRVDLAALQKVNPDIKGWIYIPDTAISYPLLWSESDNTYLRTTYTGDYSVFGSIFFSHLSSPDLTDQHTLIYGHNTKNGSMFGGLKKYKEQAYYEAHPYIYLIMKGRTYKYQIKSAFTAETSDDVYILTYPEAGSFAAWYSDILTRSVIDSGTAVVRGNEKVLTLSTCTSRTKTERFTVNAVLVDSWANTF